MPPPRPSRKLAPVGWPLQDDEVREALELAWQDGSWGRYHGPHLERLVQMLADMHGVRFVLPCSSGTVAVELALRGLAVEPGDEVLLAGYDFAGNFRAIEAVGARPVLVDIRPDNWCLDVSQVELAVSPQTRAIVVSHLHGGLADMRPLRALADRHSLTIVEDACQCPGASLEERAAGSWGDVGVLSFGGSKLLTAGRGGAIITDREDVYQRAKIFCERGNDAFPLSELQAAVLPPQLKKLAERNAMRSLRVQQLSRQLGDLAALPMVSGNPAASSPSYYKLAFHFRGPSSRDQFLAQAQALGIPLDVGFRGFTRRSAKRCRQIGELPHAKGASETTVLLHHPILLEPPEVIDQLAELLREIVG